MKDRVKRVFLFFLIIGFNYLLLSSARGVHVQVSNNEEATGVINPLATTTTLSPPEGNTTFLGGTTWCVALPMASQIDLQIALNWACGPGGADCSRIQPGGPCFQPDNLVNHASYAFNSYYQQNGNNDIACYFGGTATLTYHNPSYGKCQYDVSENLTSSASIRVNVYRIQFSFHMNWNAIDFIPLLK
ncbi:hypothetical protein Cgig2_012732 [Carnegiea gigantea]|uniref:X8 domain-containing protein n=1 Tax=Carnegiea gigantea TaxID=171969 RepID=A0A9Q1QG39_9CARY|nr:hypothetical protein Cgig2_012732 [Carnegiea gigantea]